MAQFGGMKKEELSQQLEALKKQYADYQSEGLKLDMSRGKPSPAQLDLSMDLLKITDYKGETGIDARNYGNLEGMPEARKFFADMLGAKPEETIVGGNSSLNLMFCMVDIGWRVGFPNSKKAWREETKPKFLCPAPGYDRHFRVTEYFGFELVTVPMTATGPDMDIVEKLVKDESVKGMWCVPVYSNPDGYTYSDETVKRLAKMETAAPDFKIFWDNAYCVHHLSDENHDTVLNILDECRAARNEDRPLMFCSLSKVTFPGASVAAMAAAPAMTAYMADNLFPMTISFDKLNQLHHVKYLKDMDGLAAHMKKHAAIVKPKFDAVHEIFDAELADLDETYWTRPNGGYFISLYTMHGCAKRTVQLCKEAGVVLTGAGAAYPYGIDPEDTNIRIAPTFPTLKELKEAAHVLCVCLKIATIEKLLAA
ncbi:MAG: aminotransferase class I/II-fold pyridoxal phosphate-dependent enzyme [Clostridia bacterium]|nr:aminotransferase class I/II-fold pyridoxal phosphate-dependent enzyme [Clostridia bacterium]NLS86235.1 aminotransferase class I/II-fold pyridoxal phosphate-dependent enzyme [Oscillospiraceae bacterium]